LTNTKTGKTKNTMLLNSRPLSPYEIDESRKAFGDNLKYEEIRIFEGNRLPNFLDDFGRLIKKMPKRAGHVNNAITLGNWCLFGREIETSKTNDRSWLIHELTHVWQFQTMGWNNRGILSRYTMRSYAKVRIQPPGNCSSSKWKNLPKSIGANN
jgi:hypothetical protein